MVGENVPRILPWSFKSGLRWRKGKAWTTGLGFVCTGLTAIIFFDTLETWRATLQWGLGLRALFYLSTDGLQPQYTWKTWSPRCQQQDLQWEHPSRELFTHIYTCSLTSWSLLRCSTRSISISTGVISSSIHEIKRHVWPKSQLHILTKTTCRFKMTKIHIEIRVLIKPILSWAITYTYLCFYIMLNDK